ncbi:hypothetical protein [Rhizosphaericola mali]|uniref:Uncharacterized protein n=1 Tax=Rhizosphaericola mali TaxID=2545455 RepID=A0A5P2FZN6_9BACT|nr:hypothetical protein [Rhizosphaericola mali]QES87309.1 hypothetical protein E0W69_001080 [Rhizosphaericola mali]
MKKTLKLLAITLFPIVGFAQKDSISQLRSEIATLQSQYGQLNTRVHQLEEKIPYYVNALKLQQSPVVQEQEGVEVRLTSAEFSEQNKSLDVSGIITVKKEGLRDFHVNTMTLKCMYPDGKMFSTYTINNNDKQFGSVMPVVTDIPYAFTIHFEKMEKTPQLAALQFGIEITASANMQSKLLNYTYKGVPVEWK